MIWVTHARATKKTGLRRAHVANANCWRLSTMHSALSGRLMPKPNRDRVMVSFYISRSGKAAVEALAAEKGQSKADTYRELLRLGLQHSPHPTPLTASQ